MSVVFLMMCAYISGVFNDVQFSFDCLETSETFHYIGGTRRPLRFHESVTFLRCIPTLTYPASRIGRRPRWGNG